VAEKVPLDFVTITKRLKQTSLPNVDHVIGIGTGGVVFASLVAYELERPLTILTINYRAPNNKPRHPQPLLQSQIASSLKHKHLLLVDDVSVSGQTLSVAKQALNCPQIITLVLKGQADIVLFPEITTCVKWPWFPE